MMSSLDSVVEGIGRGVVEDSAKGVLGLGKSDSIFFFFSLEFLCVTGFSSSEEATSDSASEPSLLQLSEVL